MTGNYTWTGDVLEATNGSPRTSTTFLEAAYGWMRTHLGSMIVMPVRNRFNAGLGNMPFLFPDANVIDPSYYAYKALSGVGPPNFVDGRVVVPPSSPGAIAWPTLRRTRRFPGS